MSPSSSAQGWKYNFVLWMHGSTLYVGVGEEIEHISAVLKSLSNANLFPDFPEIAFFVKTLFPSNRGGWLCLVSVVFCELWWIYIYCRMHINATNKFDFYCFKNFTIPPAKHFGFWLVLLRDEVWGREMMFSQLAKGSPFVVVSG